ncbi:hypothetical protein [Acinetobacter rudis]|uniref:hypothetical protein n=1 Tax=Acinetobacter rudis TaxID=632955 RepID=UPI003340F149
MSILNKEFVENDVKSKDEIIIKVNSDFPNIVNKSPYSHKSEEERRLELMKSVEDAKAALNTFSYQHKSRWMTIKKFFFSN